MIVLSLSSLSLVNDLSYLRLSPLVVVGLFGFIVGLVNDKTQDKAKGKREKDKGKRQERGSWILGFDLIGRAS